ncbi:MAG: ATP-binding protein [Alistipes onderdonkii]
MERIKAVFNWSGGKDSAHALLRAMQSGKYEIVALLTTVNRDTHRSTMHGIPTALLQAAGRQYRHPPAHRRPHPERQYGGLRGAAMSRAVEHFKAQGVTCFIFGDIFLHDVRKYREQKLAPHGIGIAEPLWGKSSSDVMHDFLASGLRTVIVTTMADSLGADAVGREIDPAFIASLPAGVDPNGENGEYHTFCYDGPIFRTPVPFRLGTPLRRSYRIRLDDGSEKSYSYWFADLQQA